MWENRKKFSTKNAQKGEKKQKIPSEFQKTNPSIEGCKEPLRKYFPSCLQLPPSCLRKYFPGCLQHKAPNPFLPFMGSCSNIFSLTWKTAVPSYISSILGADNLKTAASQSNLIHSLLSGKDQRCMHRGEGMERSLCVKGI